MEAYRPKLPLVPQFVWHAKLLFMVLVWAITLLLVLYLAWTGVIQVSDEDGTYDAGVLDNPGTFFLAAAPVLAILVLVGHYVYRKGRIWWLRNADEKDTYRDEIHEIRRRSSEAGSIIAMILAIPFILIAAIIVLWLVFAK